MHITQRMELFSRAYAHAVIYAAGFNTGDFQIDNVSTDCQIADDAGREAQLSIQLKATSQDALKADHVAFELPIKNYNDLRKDVLVPKILVVVLIPSSPDEWVYQSENELALRHCGYWLSLRGKEEIENLTSITVHLPRTQVFSVEQVRLLIEQIGNGEFV